MDKNMFVDRIDSVGCVYCSDGVSSRSKRNENGLNE
jgi:hypothetical protein